MVFTEVFVLFPSSARWLLIWSYFSSQRYFTNHCCICLKVILRLLTCVIHLTVVIIRVSRESLSRGLPPVSFVFCEEVPYFSCLRDGSVMLTYRRSRFSIVMILEVDNPLPYAPWSWSFFLCEADPHVSFIGLLYILFLSRCPLKCVPFLQSVLSGSSFPSDLTSCLNLTIRVSHSRCLSLVSLFLYSTP